MTPSRAHAASENEEKRDTIPAPPPSAADAPGSLADATGPSTAVDADDVPVESRVSSRRRDTVPAPAEPPGFEEEPPTDRSPAQTHETA
jgi:hypothetical protein